MSNINENLKKIESAVYGKDVRKAIHDSIHDCYEDGKAGTTDLIAREKIENLENVKADKTEVAVERERINNLSKMKEGSTTGDAELQDIRIGADGKEYPNAGEAVREQLNELKEDIENLNFTFDERINNYTSGKILSKEGEVIDGPSNYVVSEFIDRQLFTCIYIKYIYYGDVSFAPQICYYDENKVCISTYSVPHNGENENILIQIPKGTFYFRFSVERKKWNISLKLLKSDTDSTGNLLYETYKVFNKNVLKNKQKYIAGAGVIYDNIDTEEYCISDFINCSTFRKMIIKECYLGAGNLLVAFYDKNKEFVGGIESNGGKQVDVSIELPNEAYYMLLSSHIVNADYKLYITELGVSSNLYDLASILTNKKVVFLGDSITAGQGSSTYVDWTEHKNGIDYVYRGNAPGYPNAGDDYEVGEQLLTSGTWYWYESLSAHGWAQKLKEYLISKFNCDVHNKACAGINSTELRNNFNSWAHNSDIVFIMIGTNDRGNNSKEVFYQNLEFIIKSLLAQSKIPVLLTSIPATLRNEELEVQKYHMEDVAIIINKLANKYNLTHYSFFNDIQKYCYEKGITFESLLSDDLHPNDDGYSIMFRMICYGLGIPLKIEDATW